MTGRAESTARAGHATGRAVVAAARMATLVCLFAVPVGLARDSDDSGPRVSVDVSAREISTDGVVRVTVTVSGSGAERATIVGAPAKGERLVPAGGFSTSTQMSWVNGRFTSAKSFTVDYVPSGLGGASVPSFSIDIGGTSVRTDPVPIRIVERASEPQDRSGSPSGDRRRDGAADERAAVEMQTRISRSRVYLGESLTVEYVLRTRGPVSGFEPDRLDPIPDFLVEDSPVHPRATEKTVTGADGRQWTEYVLFRRRLSPTRAGTLEIPPVSFRIGIPSRRRDLFGLAFGSSVQAVARLAAGRAIEVVPLPDEGRPAAFSGAVGQFRIDARLSSASATAGQAVSLEVDVAGDGPLDTVSPPEILVPGDVQVFSPQQAERQSQHLRWVFPLVPRAEGRVRIEGVRFSYFDPSEAAYRELRAGPFTLEVSPAGPVSGAAGSAAAPVRVEAIDLRFVHTAPAWLASREPGLGASTPVWAALIGPLIAVPALIAAGRWRRHFLLSPAGRRMATTRRIKARLRDARRAAPARPDEALLALMNGFHVWAGARLGEPSRPLDRVRLRRLLAERTADPELAQRAVQLLDRAEAARYAGEAEGPRLAALIDDAESLFAEGGDR